eukprot:scaffold405712_cov19-Prasinocladus_malaysianus.AAC.1
MDASRPRDQIKQQRAMDNALAFSLLLAALLRLPKLGSSALSPIHHCSSGRQYENGIRILCNVHHTDHVIRIPVLIPTAES